MPVPDTIDPGNACGSVRLPGRIEVARRPPTYPCDQCDQVFRNIEALRTHRLNEHRIERPMLLVTGIVKHLDRYSITRPLLVNELVFFEHGGGQNRWRWAVLHCDRVPDHC